MAVTEYEVWSLELSIPFRMLLLNIFNIYLKFWDLSIPFRMLLLGNTIIVEACVGFQFLLGCYSTIKLAMGADDDLSIPFRMLPLLWG